MPFLDNDVVVKTFGDKQWTLVEQLRYQGNQNLFTVPPNFNTDFASVPRVFVWFLPRYSRYTKAAILHDYLCDEARVGRLKRSDADGLFRRAMMELEVAFLRRWIMWAAVRVGGGVQQLLRPGACGNSCSSCSSGCQRSPWSLPRPFSSWRLWHYSG